MLDAVCCSMDMSNAGAGSHPDLAQVGEAELRWTHSVRVCSAVTRISVTSHKTAGKAICYVTQHLDTGAGRGLILSSPASAPAQHCITITHPDTDNLRLWSLFHSRFLCQSYLYFHRMIWWISNESHFWFLNVLLWSSGEGQARIS